MNTVQIICILGMCAMCFVIGRATKRWRIPIMGTLIFDENENEPKLLFKCNKFSDLKSQKYIAIKIESRQNQQL